jgi:hypothetical protein
MPRHLGDLDLCHASLAIEDLDTVSRAFSHHTRTVRRLIPL